MALLASSGSLEREGESVRKQSYAVKNNKVPGVIKYAFSGIDNLCKHPDNRPLALIIIHKVDDVPTLLRFKFGAIPNTLDTGAAICITFGLT